MTEWESALEQERKLFPETAIPDEPFLRGWQWGQRYAEYRRWFKEEYWEDYIKSETKHEEQRRTT